MYPDSFLQWLGTVAILFAILIVLCVLILWLYERKHKDNDEGRAAIWFVFEIFSAIFVVTGLLVAIYSDSRVLRAVAGISMIVLVSAATAGALRKVDEDAS